MTSDDPSPPGSWLTADRSRTWRVAVAFMGAVILAGVAFYLGRVSAEDPESVAAPTTEVRSSSTTTGSPSTSSDPDSSGSLEPPAWERVETITGTAPFSLVSHDGILYLFGWESGPSRDRSPDVVAWSSDDGSTWQSLGTVLEAPDVVHSVVSTPMGLMAFSFGESATFFTSSDGLEWTAVELPVETGDSELRMHAINGVAANDESIVVLASDHLDVEGMVVDALPDELKAEGEFLPYGMGFGGPPFEVTVHGPLGITVFKASVEELGLDDEEIAELGFGGRPQAVTAWVSSDGQTWAERDLGVDHVQTITTSQAGEFRAFGFGERGSVLLTSPDGLNWTEDSISGFDIEVHGLWNDKMIGLRHRGPVPELVFSSDGDEWESFGLEDILTTDRFWNYMPAETGPAGIAVLAVSYDESEMEHQPEPVAIERDGYTLTFDEMRGELTLASDDEEILDLFIHSEQIHEEIEVDFGARTVTFLDPGTLDPLVSFSFQELEEAQARAFGDEPMGMGEEERVLLFSKDGETWSVQDLDDEFGPDAGNPRFTISEERIVAVVPEEVDRFGENPPDLTIWIGTP